MLKESEVFVNPIKSQLNTKSTEACTYFACDTRNDMKNVFVEGPFLNTDIVSNMLEVNKLKSVLAPCISLYDIELIELYVTDLMNCKNGLRSKLFSVFNRAPKSKYCFLVCDNFIPPAVDVLQTKRHGADTLFDWDSIPSISYVWYSTNYDTSIFSVDRRAAFDFVRHVLLSWVLGVGNGELKYSEFVYDSSRHKVFQVGSSIKGNFEWNLCDTDVASFKTKAGEQMIRYIDSTWRGPFQEFINDMRRNSSKEYLNRINIVADKNKLFKMIRGEEYEYNNKRKRY